MQAMGNPGGCGSSATALLYGVCLVLSAGCGAPAPVSGTGAGTETAPLPAPPSEDAGTPSDADGGSEHPDGGTSGEADAGLPDAEDMSGECTHTTLRWEATLDGGVPSGRAERRYDTAGRLLQAQVFSATDTLLAEHVYGYEPGGRLSDERTLTTYTYDAAGQFRMREERVLYARSGFETAEWETAPPGFLLERTEAHGPLCQPPPDAPPPRDSHALLP